MAPWLHGFIRPESVTPQRVAPVVSFCLQTSCSRSPWDTCHVTPIGLTRQRISPRAGFSRMLAERPAPRRTQRPIRACFFRSLLTRLASASLKSEEQPLCWDIYSSPIYCQRDTKKFLTPPIPSPWSPPSRK